MNAIRDYLAGFNELSPSQRLRFGAGLAAFLIIVLLYSFARDQVKREEKIRNIRESELAELMTLKQRYSEAASKALRASNLLASVQPDDSPAKLIEEIGIKGRALQVKPLKTEERGGFSEEVADVKIDSLTPNEAVNLLYRLEYGTRPVTVRKAVFKSRFEDPSRLDLSMTIALRKGSVRK